MNASPFRRLVVESTSEIKRIAALPRRAWSDDDAAQLAVMLTRELKTPTGTQFLRSTQAVALYEAMEVGGLFGPIRVGAGKSLICALMPLVLEARRPVLLMPASLVGKTWSEYEVLKQHWRLPSNVQIISYESLSLVQSAQKLEYIQPDLIVCDEVHFLKGHRAGRTRRVVRYMQAHSETKFVGVSGTIMKSGVRDFAHLLRFALKDGAPIPSTEDETAAWADALDEKVNPLGRRQPGALFAFGTASGADALTRARRVFQSRLLETRGVVASQKNDGVTCSIRIEALEYQLSPVTEAHFETLRRRSETPCGKSFAEAAEMRMYARELALGFTYTWIPKEKAEEWDALVRQKKNAELQKKISDGVKPTKRSVEQKAGLGITETEKRSSQELQPGTTATGEKNTSNNTESLLSSTKRWSRNTTIDATSADAKNGRRSTSRSTIVTEQAGSGDCSVRSAIEASGFSGTAPLSLSAPMHTFLTQNRPPSVWLAARKTWCSFVREQIEQSHQYDTMLQVANACRAGLLSSETLDSWKAIESSYEPLTKPIFYDTAALETCVAWMREHVGIVWVEHRAFGEVLSQLSGAPYFGPGGLDASGASIANVDGSISVIASVAACGQGFNLQMFSKNLITSCPSGAMTVEQVLGRTHRDGQMADEVLVWILLGCVEHFDAFYRALEGALAAAETLGHSQKLLLADVIMPDIEKRTGPLWR